MKSIMFTEPMYRAILDGRKTMTRRLINPQPVSIVPYGAGYRRIVTGYYFPIEPRYKIGETLYLKEPYCPTFVDVESDEIKKILYKYDGLYPEISKAWENKMFMPERYARHFIEILSVKAERIQGITDEDCMREGIMKYWNCTEKRHKYGWQINDVEVLSYSTPRESFAALINSIKKGAWERNEWYWAYSFKLIK